MIVPQQADFHHAVACQHHELEAVKSAAPATTSSSRMASLSDAFDANNLLRNGVIHGRVISPEDPFTRKVASHKRQRSSRKRVTFDLNMTSGAGSLNERRIEEVLVSREQLKDLWIGNESKRRAKTVVDRFKQTLAKEKEATETEDNTSVCSSSYLNHFQQALTITQSDEKLDSLVRAISMDSPARGLEHFILPHVNQTRRRAVKLILRAQSRLPSHTPPEQKAFLLREVSKNLSKPSRRIAQLLGIGDAKVLVDMLLADTCCSDVEEETTCDTKLGVQAKVLVRMDN
jgi:hypothetical protein